MHYKEMPERNCSHVEATGRTLKLLGTEEKTVLGNVGDR